MYFKSNNRTEQNKQFPKCSIDMLYILRTEENSDLFPISLETLSSISDLSEQINPQSCNAFSMNGKIPNINSISLILFRSQSGSLFSCNC